MSELRIYRVTSLHPDQTEEWDGTHYFEAYKYDVVTATSGKRAVSAIETLYKGHGGVRVLKTVKILGEV